MMHGQTKIGSCCVCQRGVQSEEKRNPLLFGPIEDQFRRLKSRDDYMCNIWWNIKVGILSTKLICLFPVLTIKANYSSNI